MTPAAVAEPKTSASTHRRIPSLDGLRAISIGLVILAHLSNTRHFVQLPGLVSSAMGNVGVRVFFVISGFLITTLLMQERAATGRISLKQFYWRRVCRIFPAFYFFLATLLVLHAAGWIALQPKDPLEAGTFTVNYFQYSTQSDFIRHIWSLSVEEQFYLIWPAILMVLGLSGGLTAAAFAIIACPLIRLAIIVAFPEASMTIDRRFEAIADVIATGCLLAGCRDWLWAKAWYRRLLRSPFFALVPATSFAAALSSDHPHVYYLLGQTVLNVGIALTIDRFTRIPDDWAGRLLNSAPLVFVGVLSYSLYLWQQLFLLGGSDLPWHAFPVNLVLAVACALCSYYWIEQPFLRWKRRLERPAPDPGSRQV